MAMADGDRSNVQSVERCFGVLSAFGIDRTHLRASDIASHAGLARATTYRLLKTLTDLGIVTSQNGFYELTHAVIEMGAGYAGPEGVAGGAQRFLDSLAASIDEHVALAILPGGQPGVPDSTSVPHKTGQPGKAGVRGNTTIPNNTLNDEVIAITVSAPFRSRLLAVAIQPGQRLPARQTAMGRVLLAHRFRLGEQGEAIRNAGYAIADGHLERGLRAIAVPIFGSNGTPIAALSVASTATRTSLGRLRQTILPELRATARSLQQSDAVGLKPMT